LNSAPNAYDENEIDRTNVYTFNSKKKHILSCLFVSV